MKGMNDGKFAKLSPTQMGEVLDATIKCSHMHELEVSNIPGIDHSFIGSHDDASASTVGEGILR